MRSLMMDVLKSCQAPPLRMDYLQIVSALNPINIGNSVNGAFAKMLIISANPKTDYEHLLKIYYHKRDLVQLKYY